MKLLVIGATGATGRLVVEEALARGHTVSAFSRGHLAIPGVMTVHGDATKGDTVDAAIRDQEAVVNAVGASKGSPHDIRTIAARHIVAAMQRHGARRLVTMSSFGAGDSQGHGGFVFDHVISPLFMRSILADQNAAEAVVRSTAALEWVIVRPTRLTNGPRTSGPRVVSTGGRASWSVSRRDVAAFMVAQLDHPTYVGRTPALVT